MCECSPPNQNLPFWLRRFSLAPLGRFVSHPAVAHAVGEIDDEAEQKPCAKPEPRVAWQAEHKQHRRQRSGRRDEIDRRRPEGPLDVWLRDAQRKHAEANDGECEQRANAHKFADKANRQQPCQNRDDDTHSDSGDVRRAKAVMDFRAIVISEWLNKLGL